MLETSASLPSRVEEITAEWLTAALSAGAGRAVGVRTVEVTRVVWGNATKVCIAVEYADPAEPLPSALCVKGGFDDRLARVGSPAQLVLEANFYGTVREHLDTALPRHFYAGASPSGDQGIVVLEDLASQGVRFVDAGDVLTVDEVASALEVQARWHASTWGATPGGLPGVQVGGADRRGARLFFSEKYWTRHFAEDGAPALPEQFADRTVVSEAFSRLWAADDTGILSLQHGDAHPGNTYLDTEHRVIFIDWASYFLGNWAYDVSVFLGGAVEVDQRREHEERLIAHYLEALAAYGGPTISMREAMRDYARHLLRGFLWAVSPAIMQPFERARPMCDRYFAAMSDHDTLGLLGLSEPAPRSPRQPADY